MADLEDRLALLRQRRRASAARVSLALMAWAAGFLILGLAVAGISRP